MDLERRGYQYALGLQMRKDFPAAVIAAGKSYYKKVARSGPILPHIISDKLRNKLSLLGEMYSRVNGNAIGCCAEVNAANHVISKLPYLKPEDVDFSRAIRPRTMQTVPPCRNCQQTFDL